MTGKGRTQPDINQIIKQEGCKLILAAFLLDWRAFFAPGPLLRPL
jgi:hypothetical protein